jgi:hypothetical protein
MKIPMSLIIQVQHTHLVHHRFDLAVIVLLTTLRRLTGMHSSSVAFHNLLDPPGVKLWVVEVNARKYCVKDCLCFLQSLFKGLDVLRGRISPSVRRLVVCTF